MQARNTVLATSFHFEVPAFGALSQNEFVTGRHCDHVVANHDRMLTRITVTSSD